MWMNIKALAKRLRSDDRGAITVDWVVLTAAVVALAMSVIWTITTAATDPVEGIVGLLNSAGVK